MHTLPIITKNDSVFGSDFIVQTRTNTWVIPSNPSILKCLFEDHSIRPFDLCFSTKQECQTFVRKLLLVALKDEYSQQEPSPLAEFARELIKINPKKKLN